MSDYLTIRAEECDVYLASPTEYEECVVLVEGNVGLMFTMTDESRDGKYVVEFPGRSEVNAPWSMALSDLRKLLDRAEQKLVTGE
ncbi:MAG: hypothetical protein SF069_04650 [Phycisphaerae bacterium]|nr:hypothetical protein [Phycisphaerae bacterium]